MKIQSQENMLGYKRIDLTNEEAAELAFLLDERIMQLRKERSSLVFSDLLKTIKANLKDAEGCYRKLFGLDI